MFYSHCAPDEALLDRYLERLFAHLEKAREFAQSIYIGGGTPTLLDPYRLELFLERVCSLIAHDDTTEISIESNPETLTAEKVAVLRRCVTRISTGVQSFFPEVRQILGRKCGQVQLERALDLVAEADFPHWNCDLIYAVPGRGCDEWNMEFDRLQRYPVDHVSCYNLTPEEGAVLSGSLVPCSDLAPELENITAQRLKESGIFQYEVSNYARYGGECRHNQNVWKGQLLKGFGPSAAGFDGVDRMTEPADLEQWLAGAAPEVDRISREERLNEIFTVNLRTVSGWRRPDWEQVPRCDCWEKRIALAEQVGKSCPGCFEIGETQIKLTRKGLSFWDTIAEELLV